MRRRPSLIIGLLFLGYLSLATGQSPLVPATGGGAVLTTAAEPARPAIRKSDLRQVTTHPDIDLSPRLSPDGKFLAYVSRQTYNFDIWIKSTTSTRSRQITFNKADDFYPVWYPDSRALVFVSQKEDAAGDIWRIRFREVKGDLIPKGEPEKISDWMGFDGYPTVSPDGKKIAWVSDASGRSEIWFHNDNTGKTRQLTFLGGTHPAWSSKQDLIAFTSFRAGPGCGGDIWLINLHGPTPIEEADSSWWDPRENPTYRLTRGNAVDGFPTWSPDASHIIFLRFDKDHNGDSLLTPADRGALWTMEPASVPETPSIYSSPLASLLAHSINPAMVRSAMPLTSDCDTIMQPWCGGDNRVYFSSDRGGNLDIWSVPVDGPVPRLTCAEEQFRWATESFPLPERASRWYLGPLMMGYREVQPDDEEVRTLSERFVALRRVADFYPDSSHYTAPALYSMGVTAMLLGDEKMARTCLELVLSHYPTERLTAANTELALLGLDLRGSAGDSRSIQIVKRRVDDILLRYSDQSAPAAAGRLATGDLYFSAGEYTRAFAEYARVEKEYPGERDACAAAQLKIGDVYRHFASQDEVVKAYLRVIDEYPDQRIWMLPARDRVLDLLIAGRSGAEAYIARYREIVGQYSRYPVLAAEAQFRIGNLLLINKAYRDAIREFEAVETLFPDLADEFFAARMSRAEAYLRLGDSATALSLLDQLAKEEGVVRPDLAQLASDRLVAALLSSADHLRASGDLQLAALRYRTAWERDLRSLHAHRGYLECMYYQKKIDQAIDEYRQINILHPKDNILTYALGLAYSYKGTEKAELYNDPDGLDPAFLVNRSSAVIARALSYDYTMVPGYLTIAFNFEMMENYEARQRTKHIHPLIKAWNTLKAPLVDIYHRLTFYQERKPARYYERAIHELNKAIVLNNEVQEPRLEANLALNLANNYYSLGEFGYEKAYEFYQVKLKYDSSFVDKPREALIYERMGHCALVTEDLEKGPRFLQNAIDLYTAMDKPARILLNTKRLALLYEIGEHYDAAIEHYQMAAEIEKRENNLLDLMRSYRSIAYNYLRLNEPNDAILYARRALELLDSGKIKKIKGESSRMEIGFLGWYLPVPFIDFSTMGVNSLKSFTTEDERALLFSIFADSYQESKNYSAAITFVQKKIDLFHKRKNYRAEATFANNLGYIYYLKGDYAQAWRQYVRSLALCKEYKISDGIIQNSLNLGRIASGLNLQRRLEPEIGAGPGMDPAVYADSASYYLKGTLRYLDETQHVYGRERSQLLLQLAEALLIEKQDGEASGADDLQTTMAQLDRASQAKEYLDVVLDLSRRYGMERSELAATFAVAEVYGTFGEDEKAWEQLNRSRRMALRQGEFELAWRIDVALGDVLARLSRESKIKYAIQKVPIEFYLEAVDVLEAHPDATVGAMAPDMRRVRQQPYNRVIAALIQMGDQRGALVFAERLRAKAFLDLCSQEEIPLRKERHKIFLGNARFVQAKIDELNNELLRARGQGEISSKQIKEWKQQRDTYQQEYEKILIQLRSEVPELEGLIRVQPVDLLQLQQNLQNHEALVLYHLLPQKLLAWTIRGQSISMAEIPITAGMLDRALQPWRSAGQIASVEPEIWQLLLSPVSALPEEVQRLAIVPDGELLFLPWSAAIQAVAGREFAVTVSSGLTPYYYAGQKRRLLGEKIYIAGDQTLAAALIKQEYQVTTPLPGAMENSFPAQLGVMALAELIHLRAESAWNTIDPLNSRLGFPVPGAAPALFSVKEIYGTAISAGLFTLAGSQQFLRMSSTEPFMAWERALVYAGVPGFLTTLWPGDPGRELEFYGLFYANLKKVPPAAALAQTQQYLSKRGLPFAEWARFQLFGFGGMTAAEEQQFAVEGFAGKVRRGHNAFRLAEWNDAIAFYEEALQMAERQGDTESKTRLEERVLEAAVNGALWNKAIEVQQRYLQVAEQAGDVDATANSLNNLAYFYTQNGRYDQAVAAKKRYADLAQKYGLQEQEAQSLRETGLIFEGGGQYDKAIDFFKQAYDRYEQIGKPLGMGQSLRDMGRIEFLYRDNYTAALELQIRALELFRGEAASAEQIDALHNLGITHEKMGDYRAALRLQEEALDLAGKQGEERQIALSQQNLANVQWKMGDYQNALHNQNAALETFTRLGDDQLLQTAYSTRGLIALSLGQPQQALEFEQKALEIAGRREDRLNQATIQKNLGMIYRADGRFELARASFEEARILDSLMVSQRGLAYDYRNLAAIYGLIGRGPEGTILARRALGLSRDLHDSRNEAQSLLVLGTLQRRFGSPDSARHHLSAAAAMAAELYMPDIAWRAQRQLADLYAAEKNRPAQIQALYAGLESIEGMRSRIRVEEYSAGFLDDKLEVYSALIDVLAEEGRAGEALEVAERARSRSYLDLLGQRQLSFSSPADSWLAATGDSLQAELSRTQSELLYLQAQDDPLQAQNRSRLQERIASLRRAYSAHLLRVRETNPDLSALIQVQPFSKEEIQKLVPSTGAMLVYHLQRDHLHIWLITSQAIRVQRVEIGAAALADQVDALRRTLVRQLSLAEAGRTLYDELIKPFGDEIARRDHLIILPHGVLHYLPFAVLQDEEKRYLGFEHTLSFAASASVLGHSMTKGEAFLGRERREMGVLAFGNPDLGDRRYDLPFAEREVKSLKRYYPTVSFFTGKAASEGRLQAVEAPPPLVLFSCHGIFDENNPLLSALLLAPDEKNDGRLEVHEIFALRMEAFLVAMSACETGVGTIRSGDEVIGLNRSFTYAGAASQLASLWKVDDLATAVLVKRFFRNLADGDARPEALRKAQKIVFEEINPYPAFWAAFQISGDYR
jgi:CHAT domain-containing protein/Tol biopolymer transport system component